jgi:hypothetical protein
MFVGLAVGLLAVSGAKVAGAADSNRQPDTGINSGTQGKDRRDLGTTMKETGFLVLERGLKVLTSG